MARRKLVLGLSGLGLVAVVLARRQTAGWRAAHDPAGPLRLPDGTSMIEVSDGARLAVTDAGSGPLVVLGHGWTNSRLVWAAVATRLIASGHRVVLWDQRGHGQSTVGSEGMTVARLGCDLRDLLVAVDAKDAVVVGHSMGGMTIMSLINQDPDALASRARGIVLVSTAAAGMGRGGQADVLTSKVVGSRAVTRAVGGRMGPRLVRGAVGRRPVHGHLETTARMFAETDAVTRAELFRSMAAMDLRPGLAACPVPATVVCGSRDYLTRRHLGREIADLIPGARYVEIPDGGHMLPFEAPDRLFSLIESAGGAADAAPVAVAAVRA